MTVVSSEVTVCIACVEDIEHCHGTAIVQPDASYECSDDPDCRLRIEDHLFAAWEEDEKGLEVPAGNA